MSKLRNTGILISNAPESTASEVTRRIASRPACPAIEIGTQYTGSPVLEREGVSEAVVLITNRSDETREGSLEFQVADRLDIRPARKKVTVQPGQTAKVRVKIKRKQDEKFIWDKNLVRALWSDAAGDSAAAVFGFAGARQWTVYGPYWDGWDTVESKECPFRNSKVTNHPCHVGHGKVMFRNFVDIDREYLDEKRLLTGAVPEEWPFLVERGEDWIRDSDLGGFKGEAIYYFVRELVSEIPVECMLTIGCTSSFKVWLDGNQILRCDGTRTWTPGGYGPVVKLDAQPRRLVIKTARVTDEFTLSLCFIKKDVPGDKTVGVSYLHDCIGDRLISG